MNNILVPLDLVEQMSLVMNDFLNENNIIYDFDGNDLARRFKHKEKIWEIVIKPLRMDFYLNANAIILHKIKYYKVVSIEELFIKKGVGK